MEAIIKRIDSAGSHISRSSSLTSLKDIRPNDSQQQSLRRIDSLHKQRSQQQISLPIQSSTAIPVEAGKAFIIGVAKGPNYKLGLTQPQCVFRVRPLFPHEQLINNRTKVEVLDEESLAFATSDKLVKDDLINLTHDKLFRAHRNFKPTDRNLSMANHIFPKMIEELLVGISNAVMSLGAEDSGKSHTLFGKISDPGIIMYFASMLFKRKAKANSEVVITMSVMKYDDDFQDLLCPTGEPITFKNTKSSACMPALAKVRIDSLKDFFVYFRLVLKRLPGKCFHTDDGPKDKRKNPRRHHTLISFKITNRVFERVKVQSPRMKYSSEVQEERMEQKLYESEMVFIDTDHFGLIEKKEQLNLQQSMIVLENIMQYVYEINKQLRPKATHLPYDDSKFTSFLKKYLFAENQITFIGALSPYVDHLESSMKTARILQWAYNSKNALVPRVTVGDSSYKKVPQKDVGFLRRMQTSANDLEGDISMYLSNMSLRQEDKARYVESVLVFLRRFKANTKKSIKNINQLLNTREQVPYNRLIYVLRDYSND